MPSRDSRTVETKMSLSPRNGVDLARVGGDLLGLCASGETMLRIDLLKQRCPCAGMRIDPRGYVYRKSPDHPLADSKGYVREHRLVLEGVLGRHLTRQEHVHHLNGNPSDNRLENLALCLGHLAHYAHHRKSLNVADILAIRKRYAERPLSTAQIAGDYGVSRSFIRRIVNGTYCKDVGGPIFEKAKGRGKRNLLRDAQTAAEEADYADAE